MLYWKFIYILISLSFFIKGKNTETKQHSKNNTYLYLYCCETIVGGYRSVGPEQISYLFNNLVEYDLN